MAKKKHIIKTGRSYYIGGPEREYYTVTVEDNKVTSFAFDCFREGGNYRINPAEELLELARIYGDALTHSVKEATDFLNFVDKYTQYTSIEVKKERRAVKDAYFKEKSQVYKRQIKYFQEKLKKLENEKHQGTA